MENVARLKPSVETTKFDDGTYILSYKQRNWRISPAMYYITQLLDGEKSDAQILSAVRETTGEEISEETLQKIKAYLKENNLLEGTEDKDIKSGKRNKMLWAKITLLPPAAVEKFRFLKVLYIPVLMVPILCILTGWILYLFVSGQLFSGVEKFYSMDLRNILLGFIIILIVGFFHELGHSSAMMYSGGKPGRIGSAIYFIMPVMFSDVTAAWQLPQKSRLLVDLGGIYFQGLLCLFLYVLNAIFWHVPAFETAVVFSVIQIAGNLNPFIKMDGYWVACDMLGTSDLTDLVKKVLLETFTKRDRRTIRKIGRAKTGFLYVYIAVFAAFMVYFVRMLVVSAIYAYGKLYADLLTLLAGDVTVTFSSAVSYISQSLSSFIIVFFTIRMAVQLIKWAVKRFRPREETCQS